MNFARRNFTTAPRKPVKIRGGTYRINWRVAATLQQSSSKNDLHDQLRVTWSKARTQERMTPRAREKVDPRLQTGYTAKT